MVRYCLTKGHILAPCLVGWGACGLDGCHSCYDEPQEKNCLNLVNENSIQHCPYCGNPLRKESPKKTEHIFFQNIRDAIKAIRRLE